MNDVSWKHYSKNRQLQQNVGSKTLLLLEEHWKDGDTILDIGCGTGEFTYMVAARENVQSVVGIDVSAAAIQIARLNNSITGKTTYVVGDATVLCETYPEYQNTFTKVLSFGVLHWLQDKEKEKVFRNVHRTLKEKGIFVCYFAIAQVKNTLDVALDYCEQLSKWTKYLQNFKHNRNPFTGTLDDLNEMVSTIGYQIHTSYVEELTIAFDSEEKHKAYLKPILGHLDVIPTSLHEEFIDDVYQTFESLAPRDKDKRPYWYLPVVHMKLEKIHD
ncbi:juvenile hormone acid O-methyltransferase-like [Glandiceps talaboti]